MCVGKPTRRIASFVRSIVGPFVVVMRRSKVMWNKTHLSRHTYKVKGSENIHKHIKATTCPAFCPLQSHHHLLSIPLSLQPLVGRTITRYRNHQRQQLRRATRTIRIGLDLNQLNLSNNRIGINTANGWHVRFNASSSFFFNFLLYLSADATWVRLVRLLLLLHHKQISITHAVAYLPNYRIINWCAVYRTSPPFSLVFFLALALAHYLFYYSLHLPYRENSNDLPYLTLARVA